MMLLLMMGWGKGGVGWVGGKEAGNSSLMLLLSPLVALTFFWLLVVCIFGLRDLV